MNASRFRVARFNTDFECQKGSVEPLDAATNYLWKKIIKEVTARRCLPV